MRTLFIQKALYDASLGGEIVVFDPTSEFEEVTPTTPGEYYVFAGEALDGTYTVAEPPPDAPGLFAFTLFNEAGSSTITAFPTLRVSINNGAFQTLAAAGLTIEQDVAGQLLVSGFTGSETSIRFSVEDGGDYPGEIFNAVNSIDAIYAKITTGAAPQNTTLPGLPLSSTIHATPIEAV